MKKTGIKTVISLGLLFIVQLYACVSSEHNGEVVTIIDKENNRIEKGLMVNGKKEGYWAVFDTNYVIQYDIQYKNDIPDGKVTQYFEGAIFIESEMRDGKPNGKYISYHRYPTIATQGNLKMGERVGEWRTYSKDGKLNKIILFEKDTFKVILDNKLEY